MDREFLDIFYYLPEVKERERVEHISKLVPILQEKQGIVKEPGEYLEYALNRLLKGLQSTRKFARLSFATALTQVLRSFPDLTVSCILEKVKQNIDMNKGQSKSDKSNAHLGRLLAYLALTQSDKIKKAEEGEVREMAEAILKIKSDRIPLHQTCTQALVSLVGKVQSKVFDSEVWPVLEEMLSCGWEKCTADTLWLLIETSEHQSEKVNKKFLSKHWNTKQILSEKNFDALASVIIQSTNDHPIIHPLCPKLLHKTAEHNEKYVAFWEKVLMERVFIKVKNSNCRYLLFQLIPEALKLARTPELIYTILSPKLVICLMKYLGNKDQFLHSAAKHLNQELIRICASLDAPLQVAMVMTLVTPPGTVIFDNVVKTKSVQAMISQFSLGAMKEMSQILMKNIGGDFLTRPFNPQDSPSKHPDLEMEQKWSANVLRDFVNQTSLTADISWCTSIIEFIFLHAFFDIDKSSKGIVKLKTPLDQATMKIACFRTQDKISKCLAKGTNGYIEYNNCLNHLMHYVQSLLENDTVKPTKTLDEAALESWKKMMSTATKIKEHRDKSKSKAKDKSEIAFELLFLHYGLQLFVDAVPAREILTELHTCYDKAKTKRKRRSSKQEEEEPQWVDVIVDLLMSLLSQKSHLVRSVVSTVFTMICPHLTRDTLQLVLEVLKPGGSSEDNPLDFEDNDDSEEDDNEDNDDNEDEGIASGTESEKESESESEKESESESDDESDEDSSEDAADESVDSKMRSTVKTALGRAVVASDDDDDDDDLDDDAMMKLDKTLSAAFRMMTKSKKTDQEKEIQLKHYRMRVLDIIEVIIGNSNSPEILLDLIVPLLTLMDAGKRHKAHLETGQRAGKIFTHLVNIKKLSLGEDFSTSELPEMLLSLMQYSTKVCGIPMIVDTAMACAFVVRIISTAAASSTPGPLKTRLEGGKTVGVLQGALKVIEDQLKDFCIRRDCRTSPKLFSTMLEREPALFWPLANTILEHMTDLGLRTYCCTQMTTMLIGLITKASVQLLTPETWKEFAAKVINTISGLLEKKEEIMKGGYQLKLVTLFHSVCSNLDKDTRNQLVSDDMINKISLVKTKGCSDMRRIINKMIGCFPSRMKAHPNSSKKKRKRTESGSQENSGDISVTETDGSVTKKMKASTGDLNKEASDVSVSTVGAPSSKRKRKNKKKNTAELTEKDQLSEPLTKMEPLSENVYRFVVGHENTKKTKKRRKHSQSIDSPNAELTTQNMTNGEDSTGKISKKRQNSEGSTEVADGATEKVKSKKKKKRKWQTHSS